MNRGCAMVSFCIVSLVLCGFRIGSVQSEQQHDIRLSAADELCNGAQTVDRNHRYSWNIRCPRRRTSAWDWCPREMDITWDWCLGFRQTSWDMCLASRAEDTALIECASGNCCESFSLLKKAECVCGMCYHPCMWCSTRFAESIQQAMEIFAKHESCKA